MNKDVKLIIGLTMFLILVGSVSYLYPKAILAGFTLLGVLVVFAGFSTFLVTMLTRKVDTPEQLVFPSQKEFAAAYKHFVIFGDIEEKQMQYEFGVKSGGIDRSVTFEAWLVLEHVSALDSKKTDAQKVDDFLNDIGMGGGVS